MDGNQNNCKEMIAAPLEAMSSKRKTLEDLVTSKYPKGMLVKDVVPLFNKMLFAVDLMHQNNVAHGDLTLFKFVVSEGDEVSTLQIRLANRALNEQATKRDDIYALGLIAYRMILGEKDYENILYRYDSFGSLMKHSKGKRAGVNQALSDVLLRALSDEANKRQEDAAKFLQEFVSATSFDTAHIPLGTMIDGRYRVLGAFAQGSVGSVYRVNDQGSIRGEKLLLKILTPPEGLATSERLTLKKRFRAEYQTLQRIKHPSTPHIVDSGVHEGVPYFVMEQAEGETMDKVFQELIESSGWEAFYDVTKQIANALDTVHDKGVVHRDINPKNIVVDLEALKAVVIDFGSARLDHSNVTRVGECIGTDGYIAPEQIGGNACPKSDQWSLALSLHTLLAQLDQNPEFTSEVPGTVRSAIERALSVEPNDRFDTVMDFALALERPNAGNWQLNESEVMDQDTLGEMSEEELALCEEFRGSTTHLKFAAAVVFVVTVFALGSNVLLARKISNPVFVRLPGKSMTKAQESQPSNPNAFSIEIRAEYNGFPLAGVMVNFRGAPLQLPLNMQVTSSKLDFVIQDSKFAGDYSCTFSKESPSCVLDLVVNKT